MTVYKRLHPRRENWDGPEPGATLEHKITADQVDAMSMDVIETSKLSDAMIPVPTLHITLLQVVFVGLADGEHRRTLERLAADDLASTSAGPEPH
ncbi:hypothetical protein OJAV_G00232960 [Oryzias javanicus]|uniref:Uncharacterized protein n=1 Tax=Oryzias javanicus TaxID=123683 RepID=A0A3S2LKZ6_ORYJA|nr:hypothetical protein OJAV_G00232960 [Oryzias javanicus]